MKQCKYVVTFINGEKVFTSARTGRRLTGAAKVACERAEERKAELAREQAYIDECVENALILSWYEENAIEIDAEHAKCEAIAKSYADARENANAEEVKSAESFEEFCDMLDKACDEWDKAHKSGKQDFIALSGWALTEFVIRKLESAFENEDVKAFYFNRYVRKRVALFVKNALACMGWKYNASRGAKKGAVIDFLRKRDTEKIPLFYGDRYDLGNVWNVMGAVIRCMVYAKERSENAVVVKKEFRAPLARLCRKMIEGMIEAEREEAIE